MEIRDATADDARLLATEFWYPLAKQMEQYSDLNELRDGAAEQAVDGFERLLACDDHRVFLLETEGDEPEPVAFASVELGEHPSRERGAYLTIVDLYVKDGHRGRGHGTALLEHAEALADREDCDVLKVSAEWGNDPAREFYRERDYEPKQVTFTKRVE
jgi:GNAT superfamily N-acetyltransferase